MRRPVLDTIVFQVWPRWRVRAQAPLRALTQVTVRVHKKHSARTVARGHPACALLQYEGAQQRMTQVLSASTGGTLRLAPSDQHHGRLPGSRPGGPVYAAAGQARRRCRPGGGVHGPGGPRVDGGRAHPLTRRDGQRDPEVRRRPLYRRLLARQLPGAARRSRSRGLSQRHGAFHFPLCRLSGAEGQRDAAWNGRISARAARAASTSTAP